MSDSCLVSKCQRPVQRMGWCSYHAPPVTETREELALMRDVSEGLAQVTSTMRILVAVRLLESGKAETWIEAVRMARSRLSGSVGEP